MSLANTILHFNNVWWLNLADNKPDKALFDSWITRSAKITNTHIHYINSNTVHLIFTKEQMEANQNKLPTYLSTNATDLATPTDKLYFYFSKVVKITSSGYVLEFKLDNYTTYTLPFLDKYKDYEFKFSRTHILSTDNANFTDKMLEAIPKLSNGIDTYNKEAVRFRFKTGPDHIKHWYSEGSGGGWVRSDYIGSLTNGTLYYVFAFNDRDVNGILDKNSYCFIPVLFDGIDRNSHRVYIREFNNGDEFVNGNNPTDINTYIEYAGANKLIGKFILPSYYNFIDFWEGVELPFKIGNTNFSTKFACMYINMSSGMSVGNVIGLGCNLTNFYQFSERPLLNNSDKLHPLILRYMDFNYYGNKVDYTQYLTKKGSVLYNFSNTGFFAYRTKFNNYSDNILELAGNLPQLTDTFLANLQATQNVRDTSLSIAKQQAIFGGIKSIFNPIGSAISGAASGGAVGAIAGAVGGGISTGFDIAGTVMGYNNKVNMVNAQINDSARAKPTNLSYSSNQDFVLARQTHKLRKEILGTLWAYYDLGTTYNLLDPNTIKALNNVIYFYGSPCNVFTSITNATSPNNDFNYVMFDMEYLTNIISTLPDFDSLNIPFEEQLRMINILVAGLRIWKVEPDEPNKV